MNSDLEYVACPTANCGGQWLPASKVKQLRESHVTFYCPSGHSQFFAQKTKEEKRIAELEKLVATLTRERNDYMRWWNEAKQAARTARFKQYALKGVITKLKKVG